MSFEEEREKRKAKIKEERKKKTQGLIFLGLFELFMLICITGGFVLWISKIRADKNKENNYGSYLHAVSASVISENEVEEEEPQLPPALLSQEATPTSITLTWEDTLYDSYAVYYRPTNSEYPEYLRRVTDDPEIELTGLYVGTPYDIYITDAEDEESVYLSVFNTATSLYGYCDPFLMADAILNIYDRDSETGAVNSVTDSGTVCMSSETGCLGAEVKPIMTTPLYQDETLSYSSVTLSAGEDLFVTESDNGHYCYLSPGGDWVLHVTVYDPEAEEAEEDEDDEDSDEPAKPKVSGWINARTLLVDIRALFNDADGMYGIQANRTNAYGSLFTCGGNATEVNVSADPETRYDCLSENDVDYVLSVDGYNVIDGITGQVLPNYGSKDQMPVIWDLAMELKTCQINALYQGYGIVVYDGYRPLSTSGAVSGNLGNQGYLVYSSNGTDLAQGYLTSGTYNINYYIAQKSRHNRGIAADLTMRVFNSLTEPGDEAKMQTKMHTLDYRCNMEYNTWEANLLSDIMTTHGSNLEYLNDKQEWWHFQLKTDRTDLYPLITEYGYSDIVF